MTNASWHFAALCFVADVSATSMHLGFVFIVWQSRRRLAAVFLTEPVRDGRVTLGPAVSTSVAMETTHLEHRKSSRALLLHLTDIGFQPSRRGNQNRERICGFWVTSALFMYV